MLLWATHSEQFIGGAITEICNYSTFKAVRIVALGGLKFESWHEPAMDAFRRYANVWDCSRIEFYGRRGWEKKLPEFDLDKIMMVHYV